MGQSLSSKILSENLLKGPALAVFDVHGTLLLPTWKEGYCRIYKILCGTEPTPAWVEENIIHRPESKILKKIALLAGKTLPEVIEVLNQVKYQIKNEDEPHVYPGVMDFFKFLKSQNIPKVIVSGTRREVVLKQLKRAGFLEFISETQILGRLENARADFRRGELFKHILNFYPGHTLLSFDDGRDAINDVKKMGGINFGLPQGDSGSKEHWENSRRQIKAGVDLILKNWLEIEPLKNFLSSANPYFRENLSQDHFNLHEMVLERHKDFSKI